MIERGTRMLYMRDNIVDAVTVIEKEEHLDAYTVKIDREGDYVCAPSMCLYRFDEIDKMEDDAEQDYLSLKTTIANLKVDIIEGDLK